MSNTWLHDPSITWIDADGDLCVDLMQLARKIEGTITEERIIKLSLMVQRYVRSFYPDLECRIERPNAFDRRFDTILVPKFPATDLKKPTRKSRHER